MVAHLPPSIKHLLTLRTPEAWPSPPVAALNRVFQRTRTDAQKRGADNGWLVLATCALMTINRPAAVGHLYRFASLPNSSSQSQANRNSGNVASLAERIRLAALMREAALKSVIFVGVPRTILSLTGLKDALESEVYSELRKDSIRIATPDNVEATKERGMALWNSIYEPHALKLYNKLGALHPDFITFIILAYGTILAPLPGPAPQQGNLTRALGSVVGIATLRAEGRVGPQLTSHVFGLLKARNVEGKNEEDTWLSTDEGTEWVIRTVDEIVDGVTQAGVEEEKAKL